MAPRLKRSGTAKNDRLSQSLPDETRFYKSALPQKVKRGRDNILSSSPIFLEANIKRSKLGENKGFRNLLSEVTGILEAFSYKDEISPNDSEIIQRMQKLLKDAVTVLTDTG